MNGHTPPPHGLVVLALFVALGCGPAGPDPVELAPHVTWESDEVTADGSYELAVTPPNRAAERCPWDLDAWTFSNESDAPYSVVVASDQPRIVLRSGSEVSSTYELLIRPAEFSGVGLAIACGATGSVDASVTIELRNEAGEALGSPIVVRVVGDVGG